MARTPRHALIAQKSSLFKRIFDTEDGQAALAEMREFACLDRSTVMTSPETRMVDPYATLYNEGKRSLLLHVLKLAGLSFRDIERIRSIDEKESLREADHAIFGD